VRQQFVCKVRKFVALESSVKFLQDVVYQTLLKSVDFFIELFKIIMMNIFQTHCRLVTHVIYNFMNFMNNKLLELFKYPNILVDINDC